MYTPNKDNARPKIIITVSYTFSFVAVSAEDKDVVVDLWFGISDIIRWVTLHRHCRHHRFRRRHHNHRHQSLSTSS